MNILKVVAGVRYYEDGIVNGKNDIDLDQQKQGTLPKVPCVQKVGNELKWCIDIEANSGLILNWERGTKADVHYKVCDDCEIEYFVDDEPVCNNECYWYCPDFLCPGGGGFGDYIVLNIDENGLIGNWKPRLVAEWVKNQKERIDD